jgi:hypothetical protein
MIVLGWNSGVSGGEAEIGGSFLVLELRDISQERALLVLLQGLKALQLSP